MALLPGQVTFVGLDLRTVQEWFNIIDVLLTPALLVLLLILTALWGYWRRERTRGRTVLVLLVAGATLCLGVASLVSQVRLFAVAAALALFMVAAGRFAWSWISYTGRSDSLHPLPEPLEILEDVVIDRVEAENEGNRVGEADPMVKVNLRDRPADS